ncbi:PREDICTED: magnesium-dependent phosphatase 1-like [Fragaria vesca subsp. vesca]|uniref:magnesium-dependent phosphatase 1-like n=1 Tax=Fragaria vesca subsp. vesca TaxID=101020 RepID=UPI0002C377F7|nr:PREDICTED: magnesium-dependent phosphatase 1-like [Fragaria vesca subsp. vesca]
MGDTDDKVKSEALQIIAQHSHNLPALVVFDLDYTLWPFYCEYEEDDMPYLYPQALPILHALKQNGISMAVASRSPTSDVAKSFLQTLGISSFFVTQEIFSSWTHKTEHFQRIHATTGVPFTSMLFFDDEDRNIHAVSKMGVTSILVGNGVNLGALRQGLSEFARKSASSSRRV